MTEIVHKIYKYEYSGKITDVYDGDGKFIIKLKISVDIGMKEILSIEREKELRVFGIDTPELRSGNPAENKAGRIVADYVENLILNKDVIIRTYKDKNGKYGRLLADVIFDGGVDLAQHLLDIGYAKPYTGKVKKDEWSSTQIDNIIFGVKDV